MQTTKKLHLYLSGEKGRWRITKIALYQLYNIDICYGKLKCAMKSVVSAMKP